MTDGEVDAPQADADPRGGTEPVAVVLMTAPDPEAAERIARVLLGERLIACANVVPGAASIYRWEGEVHRDEEAVVFLKTTRAVLDRMLERAAELHPYDVPELLALDVPGGSRAYLEWVARECRPGVGGDGAGRPGQAGEAPP